MTDNEKYEMLKNLYSFFDEQNKAEKKFYSICNKQDKLKDFIGVFETKKNKIKIFEESYLYSDTKFIYSGKVRSLKINNREYSLADLYKEMRSIKVERKQANSEWDKAKVIYEKEINKYAKFYNLKVYEIEDMVTRYFDNQNTIRQKKDDIQKLQERLNSLKNELEQLARGK